jgi:hypothetical protein
MSFATKFRLLSPLSVDREIHGVKVTFYTCSVRTCARLSGLLSEIAGHVSAILGKTDRDQGTTDETFQSPEGEIHSKQVVQPINPELAGMRVTQRKKAVSGAITSLLSDKNRAAVGELIMDSLKDDFPRGEKRPAEECLAFIDEMDVPTFVEFFRGLAAANAKVFGDLGKELGRAVQEKAEELLGSKANEDESPEEPPQDG